ncbi:MAG: hypothetical protein ACJA06_000830 [Halocynthiibacter sp.]|jgi:hypothetical protein
MKGLALTIGLCALGFPAIAQSVSDCDWRARADAIMEPWDENTRTYAGERVRIALLDVIEPAAAPFHLLLISPPFDELGARQCKVISFAGNTGFASVKFQQIESAYDPSIGLTLRLPASAPNADGGMGDPMMLAITLNQSTGDIALDMAPATQE